MHRRPLVLFAACLAAVAFARFSPAAEELRWKFEPGQRLVYQLQQATDTTIDAGPAGEVKTRTSQSVEVTWDVESVDDDGAARLRVDVTRVKMSLDAPRNQDIDFDSASEEPPTGLANMVAPAFNALVDQDFHVTISPLGRVTEFDAPAELLESLKNLPGGAGGDAEAALKGITAPIAVLLPEQTVDAGATWDSEPGEASLPMFGKLRVKTTYRHDGVKQVNGKPLVALAPTVTMSAEIKPGEGPMAGTVGTRETTGAVLFDQQAGRVESIDVKQLMDLNLMAGENPISGTIQQSTVVRYGAVGDSDEPLIEESVTAPTAR